MLRTLPYILLLLTLIGVVYVLDSYRPDLMGRVLIAIDVFGLSDTSHEEQERRGHINALKLTFEEKQVLLNKTVFMGASMDMVRLALGDPKKALKRDLQDGREVTYFVYYLPNDKRPTILVFLGDELVQAYKGSTIDIES